MRLKLKQAIVVEGKYDAARLANLVDATILTTDGFAIFKEKQMQSLYKEIAKKQGLIILTDSDDAGFRIRHFVSDLAGGKNVLQAFVPSIPGKEPRKQAPGKEGLLGVEGVPDELILQGIETALAGVGDAEGDAQQGKAPEKILYSDLYEWGLSGGENSRTLRRRFLREIGLPLRLSKKELLNVLNTLYTKETLVAVMERMWEQEECCAPSTPLDGSNLL